MKSFTTASEISLRPGQENSFTLLSFNRAQKGVEHCINSLCSLSISTTPYVDGISSFLFSVRPVNFSHSLYSLLKTFENFNMNLMYSNSAIMLAVYSKATFAIKKARRPSDFFSPCVFQLLTPQLVLDDVNPTIVYGGQSN